MRAWPRVCSLLACAALAACDGGPDDDDATDPPGDDDTAELPAPCADGGWGTITDPAGSLHVRADGDDAGDGSAGDPLATVEEALERTRTRDADDKRIAVGPGTFPTTLYVNQYPGEGDTTDSGLILEGCGPEETTLVAGAADEPIVKISGADDVRVAGLRLEGGQRALWLWQGVSGAEIEAVHVVDSSRIGVVLSGDDTDVVATDLVVDGVTTATAEDEEYGYGVAVQMATVVLVGGRVSFAARAGILASHQADLTLQDVTVTGTRPAPDGTLGRGIHLQHASRAEIDGCTLSDNHDAGLFAVQSVVTVTDTTVADTAAAALPLSKETTGDGIVLTQCGAGVDPAALSSSLEGNVVSGSARAGIVIDDVAAWLDGNTAGADNGLVQDGTSIFVQGVGSADGPDSWTTWQKGIALGCE